MVPMTEIARVGIEHSGKWLVFGCRSSSAFLGYRESYPGDFGVDFGIEPSTLGTILGPYLRTIGVNVGPPTSSDHPTALGPKKLGRLAGDSPQSKSSSRVCAYQVLVTSRFGFEPSGREFESLRARHLAFPVPKVV